MITVETNLGTLTSPMTIGTLMSVKKQTGVDIMSPKIEQVIENDTFKLFEVLYSIFRQSITDLGLSKEQFFEQLEIEYVKEMFNAVASVLTAKKKDDSP